jgi:hypothetical protein
MKNRLFARIPARPGVIHGFAFIPAMILSHICLYFGENKMAWAKQTSPRIARKNFLSTKRDSFFQLFSPAIQKAPASILWERVTGASLL